MLTSALKVQMDVHRLVPILLEATPAPVPQAIAWQTTVLDVMVSILLIGENTYWYLDFHSCKTNADINECSENRDGCAQLCSNTVGSYLCNCNSGYRLDTDRHSCNGKSLLLNSC